MEKAGFYLIDDDWPVPKTISLNPQIGPPGQMRLYVGRPETAAHHHAITGAYPFRPRSTPDRSSLDRKSQFSRRTSDNTANLGTRIASGYKGHIWWNERQSEGCVLSAHCEGFRGWLGFSNAISIGCKVCHLVVDIDYVAWLGPALFLLYMLTMFFLFQQGYRVVRRRFKGRSSPTSPD